MGEALGRLFVEKHFPAAARTRMAELVENLRVVVQERLGHSTITTTMNIYSHVTPTMQRSAIDRFAAHLGDTSAGA